MKLFIFIILFQTSIIANAACHNDYVCNGFNCGYQNVCDSTFDTPSFETPPIPSVYNTDVQPLPSFDVPPIGTKSCQYMQVNGTWRNVCN